MLPFAQPHRNLTKLLATMQKTIYNIGDDGDSQLGIVPSYTVLTTGAYSGTTTVNMPHYAAATISFDTATKKILDSANLMATFIAGDTIVVRGSVSNNGTYTVATGATAAFLITTQALVLNEAAGAYITICKQVAPSNECIFDNNTGLMWRRYTTNTEKVGPASDGTMRWYDATLCFTLHPADANLSMDAPTKTLKIAGAAATEINQYSVGDLLELAGFAVANNNKAGGYRVVSVTANGADLDIVLWTGFTADATQTGTTTNGNKIISGLSDTSKLRKGMAITGIGVGAASVIATIDSATQITGTVNSTASAAVSVTFTTLATEAAGGSRSIKIVCRSMFPYIAAYNVGAGNPHTDWRAPKDSELVGLRDMEATTGVPNSVFTSWPNVNIWSSVTTPTTITAAITCSFNAGTLGTFTKSSTSCVITVVRG
jgi:hypothetical protein